MTAQAPARRYPATVMLRAKELRRAGWTLDKVCDLVEQETGMRPAKTTVALWCYSEEKKRRRRRTINDVSARRRARELRPTERRTPAHKMAVMQALRAEGLSYEAIAGAARVLWGEDATGEKIRQRLSNGATRFYRKGSA